MLMFFIIITSNKESAFKGLRYFVVHWIMREGRRSGSMSLGNRMTCTCLFLFIYLENSVIMVGYFF